MDFRIKKAKLLTIHAYDAQKQKEIKAFVREYKGYAKKSAENVLGLARTIMRVEDELGSLYRTAFYAEVGLDHDPSKLTKLKKIGENLTRFQPYLEDLPNSWTTLYELARLDDEDFRKVADSRSDAPAGHDEGDRCGSWQVSCKGQARV